MKICSQIIRGVRGQRGVTAIVVAIVLPILIGFVALAVDIGFVAMTKNELQNIADATSLAGAGHLGSIYKDLSYAQQQSYVCQGQDLTDIQNVITDIASKNKAGGMGSISINVGDVEIGTWDGSAFNSTANQPDAVKVTARRDGAANGPITTFFARIFGIDTADVEADAIAALGGQAEAEPGEIELPVGISSYWFENSECNDRIKFSPSNDPQSCAGWSTFTYSPASDSNVRKILNEEDGYESPELTSGVSQVEFIGGDLSKNTFEALLTLFQKKGYDVYDGGTPPNDPILDGNDEPMQDATGSGYETPLLDDKGNPLLYPDGTPRNKHEWETTVMVYKSDDCSNPNQSRIIEGFARIVMFDVSGPSDKSIEAIVICQVFDSEETRSGGGRYGVKGTIPSLVE